MLPALRLAYGHSHADTEARICYLIGYVQAKWLSAFGGFHFDAN